MRQGQAGGVGPRRRRRGLNVGVVFALVLGIVPWSLPALADPNPMNPFTATEIFTGLNSPIAVEFAPDGRIFVAEKSGVIKAFDSLSDPTPTTVINVGGDVYDYWDRGLLGFEIDPSFDTTPYLYMLYALDDGNTWGDTCPNPPGDTNDGCVSNGRLSRIQVNASNQPVGGEQVLLENKWCEQYPSHSIGDIAFGQDGRLYMSAGDGASFNWVDYGQGGGDPGSPTPKNPCGDPPGGVGGSMTPPTAEGGALRSQDLLTTGDTLTYDGSILRLNKGDGTAAAGNPLLGGNTEDDRVIAHGLRNPFRITVRPGTNEIWIGDVGWNDYEEINRIVSPTDGTVENFGWPCYEGSLRQAGYDGQNLNLCENIYSGSITTSITNPYYPYAHGANPPDPNGCSGGGASTTGVAFYEGGDYPASFDGALFFSDYTWQCIWVMYPGGNGLPNTGTIDTFVSGIAAIDLEIGTSGDLFAVDILAGKIYRIEYPGSNNPPLAVATGAPTSGTAPLTVNFDGSGSSDPDSDPITYAWDLDDDGQYDDSTAVSPSFTYTSAGTYVATLRVRDDSLAQDFDSVTITVNGAGSSDGYIDLPGSSGNYLTAPHRSAFGSTITDIDVRADVSLDNWSTNFAQLVHKYKGTEGGFDLVMEGTTRKVRFSFVDTALRKNIRTSTVTVPFANGERGQLRATMDGSSNLTTFYYRTDTTQPLTANTGWTVLGSPIDKSGTRNVAATTLGLSLGAKNGGAGEFWAGGYFQAVVRNGIGSGATTLVDLDVRDTDQLTSTPPNYSAWSDTAGNSWTVNGSSWSYVTGSGGGNNPPVATINGPTSSTVWTVGQTINFSGSATDAEDGNLPASALDWELILEHCDTPQDCHQHPIQTWSGIASGSFVTPDHEFPSYLVVNLVATDSDSATGTDSVQIDPDTTILTFASSPSGLLLTANGTTAAAPFTEEVIVNSQIAVNAPSPQSSGGTTYTWQSWSDGGAQTHTFNAPASNTTYTATFSGGGGGPAEGFVELPGSSGNNLTTPHGSIFGSVLNDIDIRVDVTMEDWATNFGQLVHKYNSTQGGFDFVMNGTTTQLRLSWVDTALRKNIRNSTAAIPFADGERGQLRVTLDGNNGSSQHVVTFYYRTDTSLALSSDTGWTVLGNPVVTAGVRDIAVSTYDVTVGAKNGGTAEFWAGDVYQVRVEDGLGASNVLIGLDLRDEDQLTSTPPDYSDWQDSAGNAWSINGGGWTYHPPT